MQPDPTIIHRIAAQICATEAAAFAVKIDQSGETFETLSYLRGDGALEEVRERAIAAFRELAHNCISQRKDAVVEIEGSHNEHGNQYCLVMLAKHDQAVVGAATFIVRCKDAEEAKTALKAAQLAASG